jgi:FkbM family methyltransferase
VTRLRIIDPVARRRSLVRAGGKELITTVVRRFGYDLVYRPGASLDFHLAEIIESLRIDCVLDVGAHVGRFGRRLRAVGYSGPIVSFEPVSGSFRRLQSAAVGDEGWEVHRLALGRAETEAPINLSRRTDLCSFLPFVSEPNVQYDGTITGQENVPVRRLDQVFDELVPASARRAFLKIDTQGWDMEVLAGASGCLDRIVALQVELALRPSYEGAPSWLEALEGLRELPFAVSGLFPIYRDSHGRLGEIDAVLVAAPR